MQYVRALWHRKWLLFGVMGLFALMGAQHSLRQPQIYSASATLIIDVADPLVLDSEIQEVVGDEDGNYWETQEYLQTQREVLASLAVLEPVVERLGLRTDPAFLGVEHLQEEARAQAMAEMDVVALVRSRITISPSANSRVMRISAEDQDPSRAALLANELAKAYIAENLALRLRATEQARTWLKSRLEELGARAHDSSLRVHHFQRGGDLITLSVEDEDPPLEPQESTTHGAYDSYNVKLIEVRKSIATLEARLETIQRLREGTGPEDLNWAEPLVEARTPAIQELRARLLEQRTTCVELGEHYLEEHPRMRECRELLAVLHEELRRSLDNIIYATEASLLQTRTEERNLVKLVAEARAEDLRVSEKQLGQQRLRHEAENDRRLYALVLRRLKELELSGQLRTNNVRMMDPALPPTVPVRPNLRNTLTLFTLLGLLAGVALVVGLEFLNAQRERARRRGEPSFVNSWAEE